MPLRLKRDSLAPQGFLDGQMLLAMPGMLDSRFARSVIYMCAHSDEGAMGIVINQPARKVSFSELLVQLDIVSDPDAIRLPAKAEQMPVLKGGPVEPNRGFVLHSAEYSVGEATLPIDEAVSLTATLDILRAIAHGEGPDKAVLALGYASWVPGQLEAEIQNNGWLYCDADANFVFDTDLGSKYDRVLQQLGIEPAMLSSDAGHA